MSQRTIEIGQVYSWEDPDTGELLHFDVARLWKHMSEEPERCSWGTMLLTQESTDFLWANRGIEQERLEQLTEEELKIPGIACLLPGDVHLTIDGHHRAVRRYERGYPTMDFIICPEDLWRQHLLETTEEVDEYTRTHVLNLPPRA